MSYFHMKTKILADFQICISVALNSLTIFVYHNASFSSNFYGYTASLENYVETEIALLGNIIMHLIFTCYEPSPIEDPFIRLSFPVIIGMEYGWNTFCRINQQSEVVARRCSV